MRVTILHRICLVAMLVVGVLGLAGPANAQAPSNLGFISGMVRSDTGAALPNVFLEIWREAIQLPTPARATMAGTSSPRWSRARTRCSSGT